jgi:hypothetical protein
LYLPVPNWYGVNKEELQKKRDIQKEKRGVKQAKEKARMDSYPKEGMTTESHAVILKIILALLGRDKDRAYFRNGEGFNSIDSKLFHREFDQYPYCDDYTLLKHCKRLNKYKEQIVSMGFKKEDIIPKFNEPKNWFV